MALATTSHKRGHRGVSRILQEGVGQVETLKTSRGV